MMLGSNPKLLTNQNTPRPLRSIRITIRADPQSSNKKPEEMAYDTNLK